MYFDRFDICEAYFVYAMLWHSGGLTERDKYHNHSIDQILHNVEFRISPMIEDENDLTENGLAIYNDLVNKYEAQNER